MKDKICKVCGVKFSDIIARATSGCIALENAGYSFQESIELAMEIALIESEHDGKYFWERQHRWENVPNVESERCASTRNGRSEKID